MMPELISTEQVRADQIEEGDRIVFDGEFCLIGKLSKGPAVVCLRDEWGIWMRDLSVDALVLRQAAPASSDVVNIARCPEHGLHGCRTECFVCGKPVEQVQMIPLAAPASPIGLREKLDDMRLHEDTGDPLDEGYMQAIRELDDWLAAPASPVVTDEMVGRARDWLEQFLVAVEANDDCLHHRDATEDARSFLEAALASKENTGGEG